jgi:hypothetical protein
MSVKQSSDTYCMAVARIAYSNASVNVYDISVFVTACRQCMRTTEPQCHLFTDIMFKE